MIEQVRYTWAHQGLAGLSGFQPVAASAGIQRSRAMWSFAVDLCRYDAPHTGGGSGPASVGWVTIPGYRCAFVRVPTGEDGFGRPGNFAAHVLVGPQAELTAALVLDLLDAGFFWQGMAPGTAHPPVLPALDAIDLRASVGSAVRRQGTITPTLARAFWSGLAVVTDEEPDAVLRGLRQLEARFPGVLETTSFSTYESVSSLSRTYLANRPFLSFFKLIGSGREVSRDEAQANGFEFVDAHWRGDLAIEQVTAAVLADSSTAIKTLERSWGSLSGRHRFALFKRTARVIALAEGAANTKVQDLGGLLSEAGVVQQLLDYSQLRALVAHAFVAGETEVGKSLVGVFSALDQDTRVALAEDMVAVCASYAPHELAHATERVSTLGGDGETIFAAVCVQQSGTFRTRPGEWPRNLVQLALRTLVPEGAWPDGLEGRAVEFIADIARNTTVSDAHFARLWQTRLRASVAGLPEAITHAPGRLPGLVRQLGSASVVNVLESITEPRTVLQIVRDSGVTLDDDVTRWAATAITDPKPQQRLAEVVRLQQQVSRTHEQWCALAQNVIEAVVVEELNDTSRKLLADGLLPDLRDGLGTSEAEGWQRLIRALTGVSVRAQTMAESPLMVGEPMRARAAEYAIDLLLNNHRSFEGQAWVFDQLGIHGGLTYEEGARAILRAGYRGCIAYGATLPAAAAIRNVYGYVAVGKLAVKRHWGSIVLSSNDLQRRSVDISKRAMNRIDRDAFISQIFEIRVRDSDAAQKWIQSVL